MRLLACLLALGPALPPPAICEILREEPEDAELVIVTSTNSEARAQRADA